MTNYLRTAKAIEYLETSTGKNVISKVDKAILNTFKKECNTSGQGSMSFSTRKDVRLEFVRDYLLSLNLINGGDCD